MSDSSRPPRGPIAVNAAVGRWPVAGILVCSLSGCATHLCQSDFDHHYAAYGGRRARADMVHGRVGSIFDPAAEAGPNVGPHQGDGPWLGASWTDPSTTTSTVQREADGPKLISPTAGQIVVEIGPPEPS